MAAIRSCLSNWSFFVSAHSRHVRLVYVFLLFRHKVQYNVQLVFAIEWKKHNKTLQNIILFSCYRFKFRFDIKTYFQQMVQTRRFHSNNLALNYFFSDQNSRKKQLSNTNSHICTKKKSVCKRSGNYMQSSKSFQPHRVGLYDATLPYPTPNHQKWLWLIAAKSGARTHIHALIIIGAVYHCLCVYARGLAMHTHARGSSNNKLEHKPNTHGDAV